MSFKGDGINGIACTLTCLFLSLSIYLAFGWPAPSARTRQLIGAIFKEKTNIAKQNTQNLTTTATRRAYNTAATATATEARQISKQPNIKDTDTYVYDIQSYMMAYQVRRDELDVLRLRSYSSSIRGAMRPRFGF